MKGFTVTLGAALIALILEAGLVSCCQPPGPLHMRALPPTRPVSSAPPQVDNNVEAPPCTTIEDAAQVSNVINGETCRWEYFNVHPDISYNQEELDAITDAMWYVWQEVPCIRFGIWPQHSTPSGDYVRIIKGASNGCNSLVGRQGGRQDMNLQSPGCMSIGTIMHEIIHALGFFHEQSRPDRDDYVNIHYENIIPGWEYAFKRRSKDEVSTYGIAYNVRSIMHNGANSFSLRSGQPTITAKNGEGVGSIGVLQWTDKRKLKHVYCETLEGPHLPGNKCEMLSSASSAVRHVSHFSAFIMLSYSIVIFTLVLSIIQ